MVSSTICLMADDEAGQALSQPVQALYDEAPCALFSTRPDGEIVRANRTFADWLGVPLEDIIGGLRFPTLLTMGSRIYYETHYAPLLRMQGFVSEIALDVRSPAGRVSPVVASARQVRDAAGHPVMVHVALFDATHRRSYERELLQERKRAEEASRSLEAADRRKNEFIAMLAHELRNPLAPLVAAIELQRREPSSGDTAHSLADLMRRQVDQMARLVEDLLDVSRIGQDKLSIRKEPVDLVSVVEQAIEGSASALQVAQVHLAYRSPASSVRVEADGARLVQVVGNLLNNAAKFTPAGGHVTLTLKPEGDDAVISIHDTGIGVAPDQLPFIFDMFMQAHSWPGRKAGLGLGLTLARNLVERHGGRLTAHSEGLGRGTTFTIRLPLLPS
jgi:signal transduction histidine kinase